MKRIANYLVVLALAALAFTSCEDVPSPFGQIVPPKKDDVVVIEPSGKGTLAEPYNVAGVIEYLSGLGADVPSSGDVYIKGVVTSITEAFGTQYGNATFEISDTEDGGNKFLCYRVKYLGNTGYSDPTALNIKEKDVVIICGKVVNYKGNTPETSANAAYVYSINGTSGGSGGGGETPSGDLGTKDAPITVAQALAAINKLADGGETGDAYVKGIISKVQSYNATYKSITYYISDDGKETNELQVYSGKGLNGADFAAKEDLAAGDNVVVKGKLKKFVKGDAVTPEINQSSEIISLTKGSGGGGGGTGEAKGTGTANDPFNIAAAIAKCKEIGETASTEKYYVKGIVVEGGKVSGGFGNVTFKMGDTKDASDLFTAYQVAGSDGEKLADGYEVATGAEVIIYGPLVNYKGNTPETSGKSAAQIVTINGKKTNESSGGGSGAAAGDGSQSNPYNVAAITEICKQLGDKETSTTDYYIKGKICSVKYSFSAQYGTATFNISDDGKTGGTEFTAYSVYYFNMTPWVDGNTQIEVGNDVVLFGKITNYGGTLETASKKACIYSLNGKTSDGGSGGGGDGGSTSGDEIKATFADLDCSNIAAIKLSDGTTISLTQEDGKSAPIYHESTKILRIYARNAVTIDAGSKKISKVVFAYDTYNGTAYKGNDEMYAEAGGNKITPTKDDSNVTVSNVNNSKLKLVNWLESGNSGGTQFRITGLTITYAK